MKFKLLFFQNGCVTHGPEAYVCASPLMFYEKPDPRSGSVLLTNECTNLSECEAKIDDLISELQQLKSAAAEKFAQAQPAEVS